ncbi:deoxyribose-phosphate aldolase [Flavobacterium amniphilum]|uniref:deoxyribose-phosphate aldolase n=1 Tax=Flavobacterium amniphilum TaxID=1834035 RepID=UPI00202A5190|nr:deoxyribose-phosphate aldolase [Flavobacterium amniphilum]MCL9804847.1 deoxyribose-phosphate aldolase [Flavobacterium amniphilum]
MDIRQYLDSTYLKTAEQANLSESKNKEIVRKAIQEAIDEEFKLIMIRPDMVKMAKEMISNANSRVLIGTVIDFPEGKSELDEKLAEAQQAIKNHADELDYVINYEAFKRGEIHQVKEEVISCTRLGLINHKVVKFIIEVAALTDDQIIQLSSLIKNTIVANFEEKDYHNVFVKSSTGFYVTKEGKPNGATVPTITLMLENSNPLPVKAAGGVRTLDEALEMIRLGVKRIGTSSAKTIADGNVSTENY